MAKDDLGNGGVRPPSDSTSEFVAPWLAKAMSVGAFGLFVASFFLSQNASIGAWLSFFGLIFLGFGVYWVQFVRCAISADGIVVGFEERSEDEEGESERKYSIEIGPISWSFGPKKERRVSFFPRVEFETKDHEKRVFTSDEGSQEPSYHVGDPVRVLYDPARPQVARINKDLRFRRVGCFVLGTLCFVPGLWYLLKSFGFWE